MTRYITLGLVAIFILANAITLEDGHNWGGDFAAYIIHAKNLINLDGYGQNINVQIYNKYPPGFPLLLTPLIAALDVNFLALKSPNILYWLFWVLLIVAMTRKRLSSKYDIYILLFLLSSPFFFRFKQSILSDLPFLFFTTFALMKYESFEESRPSSDAHVIQALLLGGFALLIRTAGIAFFAAVLADLILRNRHAKYFLYVACCIAVVAGIHLSVGANPFRYLHFSGNNNALEFMSGFAEMAQYRMEKLATFFVPAKGLLSLPFGRTIFWVASYLVWGVFLATFIWVISRKRYCFLISYFVLYFLLISLWPSREGVRFTLPLAGIILIYSFSAMDSYVERFLHKRLWRKYVIPSVISCGILFNCYDIGIHWDYSSDVINKPEAREMFAWVRENIAEDEVYLFRKQRTMALMTSRVGYRLPRRVLDLAEEVDVDWVIIRNSWDRAHLLFLSRSPLFVRQWNNRAFSTYRRLRK